MKKVVLITGASSGFGKVTAGFLSSRNYRVYGTSRNASQPGELPYRMIRMDVRDSDSVNQAVAEVLNREGRIDVLVNNAGISAIGPLEQTPMEDLTDMMDTNVRGVLRVCQAVLPAMRNSGSGLIINISSIGGLVGLPFRGLYAASKFALEGMTESLSMEVTSQGISVCLVEPGDYNTSISQNRKIVELPQDSVYQSAISGLIKTVGEQMEKAPEPLPVAELIFRIINTSSPRLRYRTGSFIEKLSVVLKTLLPGRLFEKMMMSFYKL